MGITIEPKPTDIIYKIPSFVIQGEFKLTQQIDFHHSHLDAKKLKLDLQPITPQNYYFQNIRGLDIIIGIIILSVLLLLFRKQIYTFVLSIKRKIILVPEDSNSNPRGEESCSLTTHVCLQAKSGSVPNSEYKF